MEAAMKTFAPVPVDQLAKWIRRLMPKVKGVEAAQLANRLADRIDDRNGVPAFMRKRFRVL